MEKIYSKIQPEKLLHIIFRSEQFKEGRQDLIDPENFIQCSALQLNKGKTFKPHKHNIRQREWQVIAQESWIVLSGSVRCIFYDLDDSILETPILNAGDASFTLESGHNYEILEDNTRVLEYKTGKYEGQSIDKSFI